MSDQLALALERPALEAAVAMGIEGMTRAEKHAIREQPGFIEEGMRFLRGYVAAHPTRAFSSEELVEMARVCGLSPSDRRAWGLLFLRAQREGLIERSAEAYRRTCGHGTVSLKWQARRVQAGNGLAWPGAAG